MADKWTAAFNKIPAQLKAMGAGGGTAGTIDLTAIRTLIVGDRNIPTTSLQPYAWVYWDSPAVTEAYVASNRTKSGIIHVIVDIVRDRAREAADILVPYGDATRPGIMQLTANVADAIDATSWNGIAGFTTLKQTVDAVGSVGDDLWRAILKVDIELRYSDSSRRA